MNYQRKVRFLKFRLKRDEKHIPNAIHMLPLLLCRIYYFGLLPLILFLWRFHEHLKGRYSVSCKVQHIKWNGKRSTVHKGWSINNNKEKQNCSILRSSVICPKNFPRLGFNQFNFPICALRSQGTNKCQAPLAPQNRQIRRQLLWEQTSGWALDT